MKIANLKFESHNLVSSATLLKRTLQKNRKFSRPHPATREHLKVFQTVAGWIEFLP